MNSVHHGHDHTDGRGHRRQDVEQGKVGCDELGHVKGRGLKGE